MKVILITDVKKLGQRGELKDVAEGYAQNVLIPKKMALPATAENLKVYEKKKSLVEQKKHEEEEELATSVRSLKGKEVQIAVKANEAGGLFKSITKEDIQKAILTQFSVTIPDSAILVSETIKHTGNFDISIEGGGAKVSCKLVISATK
ncbi:50S ribosomal protein L9 [Candidatus Kaiserbacteria bacterium CG10_big_fil_rev_8_21_14_0_10_45_20]|uniref:Large ribosomal subunit protein bL9 n=1 Tax=Candidatus Kaiserbacteria bacterium CG10_big_fil_rev_8_21_14_0_10_45_20 TaxID=1974607 RepID=A0A2H0UI68_9BACT|nr:MAG: 50S ribosomal protein L9 [Candidatus Kaiserbacteria bacterium CG10_big_fil_rev_8_21_14_0_10_45_20]